MSDFLTGLNSFFNAVNPAIAAGADVSRAIGSNFAADPRVREQMMQRRQQMADIGQRQQAEHQRQALDEWNAVGKHFETLANSSEAAKAWDTGPMQDQLSIWERTGSDLGANPAMIKAWRATMDAHARGQPTQAEILAQRESLSAAETKGRLSAEPEDVRLENLRREEGVRADVAAAHHVDTVGDFMARMIAKIAKGIPLTKNESDAFRIAQQTNPLMRALGGAMPETMDLLKQYTQGYTPPAQTGATAPTPAAAAPAEPFSPQPTGVGRGPPAPAKAGTPAAPQANAAEQPPQKAAASAKPGSSRETPARPPEQAKGQSVAAHEKATQAWFDALPIGAWFINPNDGVAMQKVR